MPYAYDEVRVTCSFCIICSVVWSPVPSKLVHVHKAAYVNENTGLMDTNTQVEAQLDSAPKPEIGVSKNFGVTWYQKTVFQDGGNWTLKFPNSRAPPVISINIRKIPPECRYIPDYQVEDAIEILIRHNVWGCGRKFWTSTKLWAAYGDCRQRATSV